MKVLRANSSLLIRRGLGVIKAGPSSGKASFRGMLRPNRAPGLLLVKYMLLAFSARRGSLELPIAGFDKSLYRPSRLRCVRSQDWNGGSVARPAGLETGMIDVSCRFFSRSTTRNAPILKTAHQVDRRCQDHTRLMAWKNHL